MKRLSLALVLHLIASPAAAHHGGRCYITANSTHICVVPTGQGQVAAAVTDGASVEPTVLVLHCAKGWRGAGAMPERKMQLVVAAICKDSKAGNAPARVAVR